MFRSLLAAVLSLLLIALPAWGMPAGDQPAGEVKALIPDASRNAKPLAVKDTLQWNDLLKTDAKGRLRAGLMDGSILSVGSNSELKVVQHNPTSQQTVVEMNYGKLRNQVVKITQPGGKYEVRTPNVVAGVIGTDFYIAYENQRTTVICYEGKVAVTPVAEANRGNSSATIVLTAGQMVVTGAEDQARQEQAIPTPLAVVQTSQSETNIPDGLAASQPATLGSPERIVASPLPIDAPGEKQLWDLTNQERTARGLPPLHPDEGLTQAARKHSVIMAQNRTLSHQLPGEPAPDVRLIHENVRFDRSGENVATATNVPAAHHALMEDPVHRAAILDSGYDAAGIAVTRNGKYVYITEEFAHVLPNLSEADANSALQSAIANFAASHGFTAPTPKPEPRLLEMARSMAISGVPDGAAPRQIDGVERVLIWTASDLSRLPHNVVDAISQPLPEGYSVGAYFAASARYPQGIYWVVMVTY